MIKKVALRLTSGFILGVFIGLLVSIFFSFSYSGSSYTPMPPEFVERFSNELYAYVISVMLWGSIGLVFSSTSFIFTDTDWSITKMTVIHSLLSYFLFFPIALFLNWINFSLKNLFSFTIVYIAIYIFIWILSMASAKNEIDKINKSIR